MTIEQIKDILTGNFSDPADRKYWEDKLAEIQRREKTFAENEKNRKRLYKYAR